MSRSYMATLTIFSGNTTYIRWQNYYVNETINFFVQGVGTVPFEFFPFEFGGINDSAAVGGAEMTVAMPATSAALTQFLKAQSNLRLCELKLYEFSAYLAQTPPPQNFQVVATHVGQVLNLGGTFTQLQVGLGSVLSPVGAQVPPRTYSTALIGSPLIQ